MKINVQKFLDLRQTDPERYEYENLLLNIASGLSLEHLSEDEVKLMQKFATEDGKANSSITE